MLALERTARKNLQTPVSYIGAYKVIWPLARGSEGMTNVVRRASVAVLLGLYWILVTTVFYALILTTPFPLVLGVPWLVYTLIRRRRIHEARAMLRLP